MNSVIAYKQFSLGEGLADLFASEVRNFEAFKASVAKSAKTFCNTFGYNECFDKETYNNQGFEKSTGTTKDC